MMGKTAYKIIDYINWIILGLMILGLGYTLGVAFGSGAEACQNMIRLYGCNLEGVAENTINQGIRNFRLG